MAFVATNIMMLKKLGAEDSDIDFIDLKFRFLNILSSIAKQSHFINIYSDDIKTLING